MSRFGLVKLSLVRFAMSSSLLIALAVFGNLPREAWSLKPDIQMAGFPFVYAWWSKNASAEWRPSALVANIVIWVVVILVIACAFSMKSSPRAKTS